MTCERQGEWIRGCKFEPRYDVHFPRMEVKQASPEALKELREITYVCDICVRCGKKITRANG